MPNPIAMISWNTAIGYIVVWRSCFFSSSIRRFSSSIRRLSSSGTIVFRRSYFSIRPFPIGPPITLPAIRPKVAAAVQTVVAPSLPMLSKTGPKAPAVPCPPTIGMDPVQSPTSVGMRKSFARPIARKFWEMISRMTRPKNTANAFPPLRSTFKFA